MNKIQQICLSLILIIGTWLTAQAQETYGNNPKAGKYIMLNGVRHYYECYGSGTPLLLIHGNKSATAGWAPQIRYFSAKYKVYSLDNRGRGNSELGNDSLSYLQMAKDVAEFIRIMNIDSVDIIGKSDGGIVALMLAIWYPQHIRRIVAFGANMDPGPTALMEASVNEIHDERVKADRMLQSHDTTLNWKVEQQRYRLMEFQPHISASELSTIQLPVLIMSTDRDLIRESHTMWIYRNIPGASLCILNGCTHGVAKQNPDLFNSSIDRFLSNPVRDESFRYKF